MFYYLSWTWIIVFEEGCNNHSIDHGSWSRCCIYHVAHITMNNILCEVSRVVSIHFWDKDLGEHNLFISIILLFHKLDRCLCDVRIDSVKIWDEGHVKCRFASVQYYYIQIEKIEKKQVFNISVYSMLWFVIVLLLTFLLIYQVSIVAQPSKSFVLSL